MQYTQEQKELIDIGKSFGKVVGMYEWKKLREENKITWKHTSFNYVQKRFGTWNNFWRACDFEPNKPWRVEQYTKEHLIELGRNFGKVISQSEWEELRKENERIPTVKTIENRFGSWNNFWLKCGFEPNKSGWEYTEQEVIELGRSIKRIVSMPQWDTLRLEYQKVWKDRRIPCSESVRQKFGSWDNFWRACDFEPNKEREQYITKKYTEKEVIGLGRSFDKAVSEDQWEIFRKENQKVLRGRRIPFSLTIARKFGSWDNFWRACDFEPTIHYNGHPNGPKYTEDILLNILHNYVRVHKRPPTAEEWKADPNLSSLAPIKRIFGCFERFIITGGYEPRNSLYTKEELLDILHKAVESYKRVPKEREWKSDSKLPSLDPIKRIFGDRDPHHPFNAFVEAGGYKPFGTTRKIIKKIIELKQKGIKTTGIAEKLKISAITVQKYLKEAGIFTANFVHKVLGSINVITSQPIDGIRLYDDEGKRRIRARMLEETIDNLADPFNLQYVGLPSANFIDYSMLYDELGVIPKKSLAVERVPKIANIMGSIIKHSNCIIGGERFRGLNLGKAPVDVALQEYPHLKFNFINFDWLGGWSKAKVKAFQLLFENSQLEDDAVIFLTLNNKPVERRRVFIGRGKYDNGGFATDNQYVLVRTYVKEMARQHGFGLEELFVTEYESPRKSDRGSETIELLAMGFKLERLREPNGGNGRIIKPNLEEVMQYGQNNR